MAYFAPYVDDAGLHVPTYNDIRDDLLAKFQEIYGNDLYLGNDSQDYQMISAFALKTYDTIQLLQIVYNNHSPKTAVGTGLSSLVKLNGIRRKAASYSTCVLTLTGKPGTVIAAGVAEDDQRRKWELPQDIKFESESLEVTARCRDIGAIEAPVGTITKISNPQYGWLAVTNKVPAVKGRAVETDEELRRRQELSTAVPSRNMVDRTLAWRVLRSIKCMRTIQTIRMTTVSPVTVLQLSLRADWMRRSPNKFICEKDPAAVRTGRRRQSTSIRMG